MQLAALRTDLSLYKGPFSSSGEPSWTLHDPINNSFYQLGETEYRILNLWKLQNSQSIVQHASDWPYLKIDENRIEQMASFLLQNHLLQMISTEQNEYLIDTQAQQNKPKDLHQYLAQVFFFRFPLVRPQPFLERSFPWIKFIFNRWFFLMVALLGLVGVLMTLRQWSVFSGEVTQAFSDGQYHLFIMALIFAKLIHELGHAFSSHFYGCRVPNMGVAIMVFWPVLYTETSESWKLADKRKRMIISGAGVIAELSLALLATFLWLFFPEGPFRTALILLAAVTWISTLLVNLNPFMRFDGYYLLADLISTPNLQERSFNLAKWKLREWLFAFNDNVPEILSRKKITLLIAYAYMTWIYRLFIYLALALIVYHFVFKLAGIILLTMELIFFIGIPIMKEINVWIGRKQDMKINFAVLRTSLMVFGLFFILLFPWKNFAKIPAVIQAAERANVYLPVAAQLTQLNVKKGDEVKQGEVLMQFNSPSLDNEIALLNLKIDSLETSIMQSSSSIELHQNRHILESELVALIVERQGLIKQKQKLTITAPFSGQVSEIITNMNEGDWVQQNKMLARLVDFKSREVFAFMDAATQENINNDKLAKFIADDSHISIFEVTKVYAETAPVESVNHLAVVDSYGGGLATVTQENGVHKPVKSIYIWHYQVDSKEEIGQHEVRGYIRVNVEAQSLLGLLWTSTLATLIRESGF